MPPHTPSPSTGEGRGEGENGNALFPQAHHFVAIPEGEFVEEARINLSDSGAFQAVGRYKVQFEYRCQWDAYYDGEGMPHRISSWRGALKSAVVEVTIK